MVQVSDRVGSAMKGSMNALEGSGRASMSEASMDFHPRIEEPSKPRPSLKDSSLNSLMGRLKCCQVPKVSTNLTSTILAPAFFASSNTCLGVLMVSCCCCIFIGCWSAPLCQSRLRPRTGTGDANLFAVGSSGLCAVITLFTVFRQVETDGFDLLIHAQANDRLDDGSDDGRADGSQQKGHQNRF